MGHPFERDGRPDGQDSKRREAAPWRLLAHHVQVGVLEAAVDANHVVRDARVVAGARSRNTDGERARLIARADLRQLTEILTVDDQVTEAWMKGCAAPVGARIRPREIDRRVSESRRQVGARHYEAAGALSTVGSRLRALAACGMAAHIRIGSCPWLTSPRSDVLQTSPIHEGITDQPAEALERLYRTYVTD